MLAFRPSVSACVRGHSCQGGWPRVVGRLPVPTSGRSSGKKGTQTWDNDGALAPQNALGRQEKPPPLAKGEQPPPEGNTVPTTSVHRPSPADTCHSLPHLPSWSPDPGLGSDHSPARAGKCVPAVGRMRSLIKVIARPGLARTRGDGAGSDLEGAGSDLEGSGTCGPWPEGALTFWLGGLKSLLTHGGGSP